MFRTHQSLLFRFIAASALLLSAGCAVGPKFKKPAPPDVGGYTPTPISTTNSAANLTGGEAQHLVDGKDIPGEWWALFHSKPLSDLIERSLKANPGLKAAQAALLVARENVLAQRGFYYPSVTGSFTVTRARTAQDLSPALNANIQNYSLYTPQVSVSYVPDVFGLNRRTVESLQRRNSRRVLSYRNAHYAELQRSRGSHPGGFLAGADCRHRRAHYHQYRHVENLARTIS